MQAIQGSWIDFHHASSVEGKYFNPQIASFTAAQWAAKVDEMCDLGMTTLVVMSVVQQGKAFYPSQVLPDRWPMACPDPLEALLCTADRRGAQVFVGVGYFQKSTAALVPDSADRRLRRLVPRELAERYGYHPSFAGWYLPVEAAIRGHFEERYLEYAQTMACDLHSLPPRRPVLIAPYGTRTIQPDARFVQQLQALGVDALAYQDEVGVRKTRLDELDRIWSAVRQAHDQAGVPLWADVEIFRFAGLPYLSALLPASIDRIATQLDVAARYADRLLCYQYLGMMDEPGGQAPAGHPSAQDLWRAYAARLRNPFTP